MKKREHYFSPEGCFKFYLGFVVAGMMRFRSEKYVLYIPFPPVQSAMLSPSLPKRAVLTAEVYSDGCFACLTVKLFNCILQI